MSDSIFSIIGLKTKALLDQKLDLAGGTLTGSLVLKGAPSADLEAATKAYVDGVSQAAVSIGSELNDTQAGAGLGTNGAYTADSTTNYLTAATSLANADKLLDGQAKTNADAITAINGNTTGLGLKANLSGATFSGDVSVGATGNNNGKNLNVYGATTLHGNLTVSGTTTTINTTNSDIKDSLISLSKGAAAGASATNDSGILIERGSSQSNVAFFWDEGDDKFKFASTTGASNETDLSSAGLTTTLAPIAAGDANLNDVVANTLQVGSVDLGTTDEFNAAFVAIDSSSTYATDAWIDSVVFAALDTDGDGVIEIQAGDTIGTSTLSQVTGSAADAKFIITRGNAEVDIYTDSDDTTKVTDAYAVTISCSNAKDLAVDDEFKCDLSGTSEAYLEFKITSL